MATAANKPGITPGMSHTYGERTVASRIPFVLKYLKPGMSVLDVGCGPGSITLGLADAVGPGQVIGIDHEERHIGEARRLANDRSIANVRFEVGDVYDLPYPTERFDAAVESSVFIHLTDRVKAAREIHRVLKPGGLLLTSDTCMDSIVTSPPMSEIAAAYRFFKRWQRSRGSDLTVGKRMPGILRRAGFNPIEVESSTDMHSGTEAVARHAKMMSGLFQPGGGIHRTALERDWADPERLSRIVEAWHVWAAHPDAFFAAIMCEVVGHKP